MSTASPEPPETRRNDKSSWLQWLLLSLVAVSVLTIAGVHAPARIKLIGLFAVAYGLVAGWLLTKAAQTTGRQVSTIGLILCFLMIAAGQCGMAVESYRLHKAGVLRRFENSPHAKSPSASQARRLLLETTTFPAYLRRRISLSPLGNWPAPWPAVLWALEICLSGAAGVWLVHHLSSTE